MLKRVDLKIVIITMIVFVVALAQLLPIARVLAASVQNGNEFFTGRSDYCAASAGDCDALLQYGLYLCVYQAANSGYFYSSAGKTGYNNATSNYDNAADNYQPGIGSGPYTFITDLLAYYYGVDVAAWVAAGNGACSVPVNSTLAASDIDSLDNIGASFDILEFVYGNSVPNADFTYNASSPAFVTLNNTISPFISDFVSDNNAGLICSPDVLSGVTEPTNTGMDISQGNFDVGKTPVTGMRNMYGVLDTTKSASCTTNTNDYIYLIDQRCGNISDKPASPACPSGDTGTFGACCPAGSTGTYPNCNQGGGGPGTATCTLTDSTAGYAPEVGTAVTFYLSWTIPDPQTTGFSTSVTSNLSPGTNVSPTQSGSGSTSGYNYGPGQLTDSPVDPSSGEMVVYTGEMTADVSGTIQQVYCTDSVTWYSPAPPSNCSSDLTSLQTDDNNITNTMNEIESYNSALTSAYSGSSLQSLLHTDIFTETNLITQLVNQIGATESALIGVEQSCSCQAVPAAAAIAYYSSTILSEMATVDEDGTNLDDAYSGNSAQSAIHNQIFSLSNQVGLLGNYMPTYESEIATTYNMTTCVGGGPVCPPGYLGTWPNCYLPSPPPSCPIGYSGTYPSCCPPGSTGAYPACTTGPIIPQPSGPQSYFSVSGGDTIVGTGFGPACVDDLNAGIVASNIGDTGSNPWTGASDNLAVLAPDIINGFSTANASSGAIGDPLTFDNTDNSPYGGSFGTTNQLCSQDFYSTKSNVPGFGGLTPATGAFNLSNVASNSTHCLVLNAVSYCSLSYPVQISGNPASGSRVVLYISGTAEISGNIFIYSNDSSALTSPSSIPLLYVITDGDIYIDSGVTSIDGIYVADNLNDTDKTNNGIIFTCANAGSSFASGSALITPCNSRLTVDGALVAGQIKFGRTYGDITTANGSTIAPSETINYGPEVWLSQVNTSSGLPINPDYQNITELSPVI